MIWSQDRADMHVGYRNGRTANYKHQGTGLGVDGLINGREATVDEQAAQARAWERSREATAEQLRIVPWESTTRAEMWKAIDQAFAAATSG